MAHFAITVPFSLQAVVTMGAGDSVGISCDQFNEIPLGGFWLSDPTVSAILLQPAAAPPPAAARKR
jgi:hypothetical protein